MRMYSQITRGAGGINGVYTACEVAHFVANHFVGTNVIKTDCLVGNFEYKHNNARQVQSLPVNRLYIYARTK